MARALIPLVEGFEELEAVAAIDVLRRAQVDVLTAATATNLLVTSARRISIQADALLNEVTEQTFDAIVIPGGPGTPALVENAELRSIIQHHHANGALLAALCAAPTVLHAAGVLEGRSVACYPSVEGKLKGARVVRQNVVRDGMILTSRGAGTAVAFALAVTAALVSEETAQRVADAILHGQASFDWRS